MVLPRNDYQALTALLNPNPVSEEEIQANINSRFCPLEQTEMKKKHQERMQLQQRSQQEMQPIGYIPAIGWIVF
jgi:hypothetical protein